MKTPTIIGRHGYASIGVNRDVYGDVSHYTMGYARADGQVRWAILFPDDVRDTDYRLTCSAFGHNRNAAAMRDQARVLLSLLEARWGVKVTKGLTTSGPTTHGTEWYFVVYPERPLVQALRDVVACIDTLDAFVDWAL